jgi:hypothetical protein
MKKTTIILTILTIILLNLAGCNALNKPKIVGILEGETPVNTPETIEWIKKQP